MGTDIHGWIECRTWREALPHDETAWSPAISLPLLGMPRDYDGFACLFGVRDFDATWRPVAANRGLPPDTSPEVREEHATWAATAPPAAMMNGRGAGELRVGTRRSPSGTSASR
ncbi:hypothetical protein [Streptomyces sp. NPDC047061]|uniref:hypothetical protein n=1 Tax=Streptomyces sp. NPDC047061 TaxID=3154605 RepID=UPI003401E6F4